MLNEIIKMRELISDPKRWTQEKSSRDSRNKHVHIGDPSACKFCGWGAVRKIMDGVEVKRRTYELNAIMYLLNKKSRDLNVGKSLIDANDHGKKTPEQCHRNVLRVFDSVINDFREAE